MKTGEIEEYFNITRSTISSWRKKEGRGRGLLLKVIESLPIEYVENILQNEKENITKKDENKKLLEVKNGSDV